MSKGEQRLIVTCDECGSPFPAVTAGDGDPALLGEGDNQCSNCGGVSFSRISL